MNYDEVEKLVLSLQDKIVSETELNVKKKAKDDFVTDIDIYVSNTLKEGLQKIAPEEEKSGLTDNCWILDPIDGTTNLILGYKQSSISLAHYKDGEIVFGLVFNPFTGELFTAEKGKGAYLNHKKKLSVSKREMSEAVLDFGMGNTHKDRIDVNFAIAKELFAQCVDFRRICSTALVLSYMADGRLDGYFEEFLFPWDYAAGGLILREAGGIISDFKLEQVQYAERTSLIASNGVIHYPIYKAVKDNYV